MAKTVEVEFSNPYGGHEVGDRVKLDVLEAKKVVRAGYAVYPTQEAATKAEGEAGAEKTKRSVAKRASSS